MRIQNASGKTGILRKFSDVRRASFLRINVAHLLLAMTIPVLLGAVFAAGGITRRQRMWSDAAGILQNDDGWFRVKINPDYWRAIGRPNNLPAPIIDRKFKDVRKVETQREEALWRGIINSSDDDFVSAEIRLDGQTIPVKMRLKGDDLQRVSTDKWSFRIHVKGDDHILGMPRMSIQHPMTMNYLAEWAFLENLRMEGILAPRCQFVNVVLNGERKGVYALEESFSKEMLESQQRREGILFGSDEDRYWARAANDVTDLDEVSKSL